MPRCIVKQNNDRYAIWSSVVDDFVTLDATAEEVIADELNDPLKANYPGGKDALRRDLCREFENIATTGRAWKWAPTWNEAIEIIRELHGDEVAEQRQLDALS
jgi:hypothetical protein